MNNPTTILNDIFGYSSFRLDQEEIINSILANKNVLAILPTGGGKSICYQIPALMAEGLSIVISPLIALMKDQVDSLNKKSEVAAFINSSLEFREIEKIFNQIYSGTIKLLYLAPERLENNLFVERLSKINLEYLFIDEAHCISEWGHNFRPSYTKIKDFKNYLTFKNIAAFTATATPKVRQDIIFQLGLEEPKVFVSGFQRENLNLSVIRTNHKKNKTLELVQKHKTTSIIYAATRKNAEEIAQFLKFNNIKAEFYHAGLTNELRRVIQDDFIKGNIDVICATTAFGMGIDKNNVHLIIHYNISSSIENYYQEIGRAGRDGEESYIYLLYEKKERDILEFILLRSFPTKEQIIIVYNAICNYGRIALGMKNDSPILIDKDFYKLLNSADFNSNIVNSVINVLEKANYLKYIHSYNSKHNIKINIAPGDLRKYVDKIANNTLRDILMLLLREHGSVILNKSVKVDIKNLSIKYSIETKTIEDSLTQLNEIGIIEYNAPIQSPYINLTIPRVDSKSLRFNFSDIEKQKKYSLAKIDDVINYVYYEDCRFSYILKYFGQSENNYKCGKCDNCRGEQGITTSTIEFLEEVILKTIHESFQRIRERNLHGVLTGKTNSDRFRTISTFGTCTHFSKHEIESSLSSLIDKDYVKNINNLLVLTEKGINTFTKYKAEEEVTDTNKEQYELNVELFNRLRDIRKDCAIKFSQTANIICPDEVLRNIALIKPKTPETLLNIEGFNQRMYYKIGNEFLLCINTFIKDKSLDVNDYFETKSNEFPETLKETYVLLKKEYTISEIAASLKIQESIIALQIESILEYEPDVYIDKIIPNQEIEKIDKLIKNGIKDLKEIKAQLPYLTYSQIRIAIKRLQLLLNR